ncbi:hypothetical protein R1sor_026156 [Riccia sorocarpa]|uniref:Uncharacterized protein n=1 Tax=Riccia sorocarpa TaxID=122646 RepID=A0ABD3GB80_9MARC
MLGYLVHFVRGSRQESKLRISNPEIVLETPGEIGIIVRWKSRKERCTRVQKESSIILDYGGCRYLWIFIVKVIDHIQELDVFPIHGYHSLPMIGDPLKLLRERDGAEAERRGGGKAGKRLQGDSHALTTTERAIRGGFVLQLWTFRSGYLIPCHRYIAVQASDRATEVYGGNGDCCGREPLLTTS